MTTWTGLLPAAGKATRFGGIPKYLLPIPTTTLLERHVRQMRVAGVENVVVMCSQQSGPLVRQCVPDALHICVETRSMSETVAMARNYADGPVLLGMPDTYWNASDVYSGLKAMLSNDIDVALAVWQVRPDLIGRVGQVFVNGLNRVQAVVDKDPDCPFPWVWGALAWNPSFWACIDPSTPHVGYAVAEALRRGLKVFALPVEGEYTDCGTFEAYARLCASFVEPEFENG